MAMLVCWRVIYPNDNSRLGNLLQMEVNKNIFEITT